MSINNDEIEIFFRINKLKTKAGLSADQKIGVIDVTKVNNAQGVIEEKESEYPNEVKELLGKLESSWKGYKAASRDERDEFIEKIYNYSNNIKDLTSMYEHDLMSHFSASLRDFCEKINFTRKEHEIIVQAHIDVMLITYQEKLRDGTSPKAEELKDIVAVAVSKYS